MDTLLRASIVHTTEGADISLQYSIQSTVLCCGLLPRYYALFLFECNVWLDYVKLCVPATAVSPIASHEMPAVGESLQRLGRRILATRLDLRKH